MERPFRSVPTRYCATGMDVSQQRLLPARIHKVIKAKRLEFARRHLHEAEAGFNSDEATVQLEIESPEARKNKRNGLERCNGMAQQTVTHTVHIAPAFELLLSDNVHTCTHMMVLKTMTGISGE